MVKHPFTRRQLRGLHVLVAVLAVIILIVTVMRITGADGSSKPNVKPPREGSIKLEGKAMCLPRTDKKPLADTECVFGIKAGSGYLFEIVDSDTENYTNIDGYPIGQLVVVRGDYKKGGNKTYPTIGTITVTDIAPPEPKTKR